ncbi:MAG: toprim domain-containing protein [Hyphomicrobiales bacterium]|nr:toprim domain-containing protein [Hyphomicrobiales bacterium]
MHPSTLAFSHLKHRVSIEQVLTARGMMTALKQRGQRLIGPCPVHRGDHPQAFVVDLSKDLWHCFTQCRGGGDVVDLVRRMDHSRYPDVARYLASLAQVLPTPARAEVNSPARPYRPYTRNLRLNPHAPLLVEKGIRAQTARRFEAGAYHGPGFLKGCVAVRLHDPEGRPIGYAGRRLDPRLAEQYGKWKFPSGLPKRDILYGFHRIASRLRQRIAVVECPWGVMRLAQIGIPAVALLGIALSHTQLQLLGQASRVVLMLDGDQAGRSASHRIVETLNKYTLAQVHRIDLPQDHDPDDLDNWQLSRCLLSLLP